MCDYGRREYNGDGEVTVHPTDSSSSSMSSESSATTTGSRLSFDWETTNSVVLKPHRSSESTNSGMCRRHKALALRDFTLIRRIGAGDIGTVFLCRLDDKMESGGEYYAMKVVDRMALAAKKKVERSETERKILKMLDHPFLPTLYAEFEASHFSCIVMEYCSGGDLHSLRHKLPLRRFPVSSARFYAAEVLVALEYLHMLGIIYRDLKPENVLVRSDGHIMLSDFDLSLCSDAILAVESPTTSPEFTYHRSSKKKSLSSLIGRLFRFHSRKVRTHPPPTQTTFVAEPVTARSCSFVGTHEYVAPEVAAGGSHGSAVDWWALGVFLYELIYGVTPFASRSNQHTLRNIVKRPLSFPDRAQTSELEVHARDLISGLLTKDPANRLGSRRGAAEVKTHPFFGGLNFALIRTMNPPEIPGLRRQKTTPCYNGQRKSSAFDYF